MFNFKTDFFDYQPFKEIQKNIDAEKQEVEEFLLETDEDELQESESLLAEIDENEQFEDHQVKGEQTESEVVVEQQDVESLLAEEDEYEQIEDDQVQVESSVSEVQVFHHPKDACVDINGGNVQSCICYENTVYGISDVTVKIPVVLAEFQVQVNMESCIDLPEKALEIKEIKKRVKLTQCLLMQEPGMVTNPCDLFLKGFVRKNIAYATRDCSNEEGVCGDIRHCTVDVPFSCVTKVMFNGTLPLPPVANTLTEFEYFRRQNLKSPGFAEKDQLLSGDFSEFNQVSEEFYNELPFCELICSRIVEFDEFINRTRPKHAELPFEEKEFSQIQEKMILYLTIKLLQNRQIHIPPAAAPVALKISTVVNDIETFLSKELAPLSMEECFTVESEPEFSEDTLIDIVPAGTEDDYPVEVITDTIVERASQEETIDKPVEEHLPTDVSIDLEEEPQDTKEPQPVDTSADTNEHKALVVEDGVSSED